MVGTPLLRMLSLGVFLTALASCNGGNETQECDTSAPDPNIRDCYCPDNALVPVGGDCICDTSNPDDPDCDVCDYPENAELPECTGEPQADPFVPASLFISATFAYDGEFDHFRPWLVTSGESPPFIRIDLRDRRYNETRNNAFRCGLALIPADRVYEVPAVHHAFNIPEGRFQGDYEALLFSLRTGSYEVVDFPSDSAEGGRIPGCIEVQDDPRRGFGQFNEGDIVGWTQRYSWSVGLSLIHPIVDEAFMELDANNSVRQLLEQGYINGGTIRIENEDPEAPLDLYSPGQWSLGFIVDEVWAPVPGDDNSVRIPVMDQAFNADGARPASGYYRVNAYYGFSFGS